jgi:hypothetical protein
MHSSSPPFVNAVHLRVKYKEDTSIVPGPFREPRHTCIYVTCATFVRIWNQKYSLTGNSHKMWHHCMTWIRHVACNVVSLWHLPFHELTDRKFKLRMHLPLRSLNTCHIVRFMIYFPLQVLSPDKSNNSSRTMRDGRQAGAYHFCPRSTTLDTAPFTHINTEGVIFSSKRHKSISHIHHSQSIQA